VKLLSRDAWLALGLLLILFLVIIAAAFLTPDATPLPPYSVESNAANGTRALSLWLDESGYRVDRSVGSSFAVPPGINTVLMLEPSEVVAEDEFSTLDEWIDEGGTLVLAGRENIGLYLMEHYEFEAYYVFDPFTEPLTLESPLLTYPTATDLSHAQPGAFLTTERTDYVTHINSEFGPIMVSFKQGDGRVILSTASYPFSNAGLKEAGNPVLALNIINAGDGDAIWFDEWHHGARGAGPEVISGPWAWMTRTAPGRAVLYSVVGIFVAIALAGRRFGRPVTLLKDRTRRAPLEYITALANMSRRAGHRRPVLDRYHHQLKSELGKRYRLSPALPDDEFAKKMGEFNPQLDATTLHNLLVRLHGPKVSETEMVTLAAEVAKILDTRNTWI
jgi:hypothetical protein